MQRIERSTARRENSNQHVEQPEAFRKNKERREIEKKKKKKKENRCNVSPRSSYANYKIKGPKTGPLVPDE